MPEHSFVALAVPLAMAESVQPDRAGWYCRTAHAPVLSSQEKRESQVKPKVLCERNG